MLLSASIFVDFATTAAGLAGSIAVVGFIFQALPVLRRADDRRVRSSTTVGGLFGLLVGIGVLVSSVAL